MELSEEEYRQIYVDIERAIMAVSQHERVKKIQNQYFISNSDMKEFDRLYYIIVAEIRQGIEKVFDKYIDADLARQVREESEKRKRPRKPKTDVTKQTKADSTKTSSIGKFTVESYE